MAVTEANEVERSETQPVNGSPSEPPVPPSKASATQSFSKEGKRVRRQGGPTMDRVVADFAACGRCSYFLAGYRVVYGMEDLEAAVTSSKSGWLELTWSHPMRELVQKSFAIRVDVDFIHYEGCCPECRRHFICKPGEGEQPGTFHIEIVPRPRG